MINFINEQFYIKLPDGKTMSFPNRFGDDSFKHLNVNGDVTVSSIKMKLHAPDHSDHKETKLALNTK